MSEYICIYSLNGTSNSVFFFNFILFLNLKHCISFAKHQNESATGIHTLPILNPPPSSLPTPSLWVVPVHQAQASSIMHQTWTGDSFHIWYYTCFNAILPNHPTLFLSALNMVSRLVITFLPRSKRLLISWLQSPSVVILEPRKNKVWHCFHYFPIYFPWSGGTGCHDLHFLNVEL